MYDLRTDSLWHALTGEPVIGTLANSGLRLKQLPITTTTWGEWREAHPDGKVLSVNTGVRRRYLHHNEPGAAYSDYFSDPGLMFPVFSHDDRLRPKDEVLAIRYNGSAGAYLLDALAKRPVLNDALGGQDFVIVTDPGSRAARVYERAGHEFMAGASPRELKDSAGGEWRVEEARLVAKNGGRILERLPSHTAYWFGWRAFYPDSVVFGVRSRP